ncbi:hypothetical protein [Salinigranum salinum]|uniref:hypothetical protein n=1 Tax=Salinigranum salinum TaxID=1364937 RepID=UPI0012611A83|nr:hypothetical protein [Salinigranum salinum]
MSEDESKVVYLEIDNQKTSHEAYNQFREDIANEFAGELKIRDNQERTLCEVDPQIAGSVASQVIISTRDIGVGVVSSYIYSKLTESEDQDTGVVNGDVYIDCQVELSMEDASHRYDSKAK